MADSSCALGAGMDFALACWGGDAGEIPSNYRFTSAEELLKIVLD